MAGETVTRIAVPDRGMNVSTSPLGASNQRTAPLVTNFLPGQDRRLPVRGPIWDKYPMTMPTSPNPAMMYNQGRRRTACYNASNYRVFEADGTLVGSIVTSDATKVPSFYHNRSASLRGYTYVPCGSAISLPTPWQTRGYSASTGLPEGILQWDGTTTAPTFISRGPSGVIDAITHLDRMFVLGGGVPASTADVSTWDEKLYWSDVGGPATNALAEWQDDATGLVNQIHLGHEGGNLVGLGHVDRNLVIFRYDAIQVLYGDTPSTFSLRTVMRSVGAYSKSAICDFDSSVIFVDVRGGVTLFDGSSNTNIGEAIQPILQYYLSRTAGIDVTWTTVPRVSLSRIAPEWIALSLHYEGESPTVYDNVAFYCHVPTRSWAQLSANTGLWGTNADGKPNYLFQHGERTLGFSAGGGWWMDDVARAYLRTTEGDTGTPTWRTGRDYNGTSYYYIPTAIETPIQRLANPTHGGKIVRFGMDYINDGLTAESPSGGAFSVALGTREARAEITNAAPLVTPYEASAATANSATPYGNIGYRYAMWDVEQQARTLQVQIAGPTGTADSENTPKHMELGDMYVEWVPTNPRGQV